MRGIAGAMGAGPGAIDSPTYEGAEAAGGAAARAPARWADGTTGAGQDPARKMSQFIPQEGFEKET